MPITVLTLWWYAANNSFRTADAKRELRDRGCGIADSFHGGSVSGVTVKRYFTAQADEAGAATLSRFTLTNYCDVGYQCQCSDSSRMPFPSPL